MARKSDPFRQLDRLIGQLSRLIAEDARTPKTPTPGYDVRYHGEDGEVRFVWVAAADEAEARARFFKVQTPRLARDLGLRSFSVETLTPRTVNL